MLKLQEEKKQPDGRTLRTYSDSELGSHLDTYLVRTDRHGHQWWAFVDRFTLPFIRNLAANKLARLYGHDLLLDDVLRFTKDTVAMLRSTEPDKIDRAVGLQYELERLATTMGDPVKLPIALCTLYLLLDDEAPDAYLQGVQNQKMELLSLDLELQTFFLSWWTEVIERYGQGLTALSRTASRLEHLDPTAAR